MSTLDLTSLTCPWPIIKTKQAMDQLSYEENLLIVVNDPSFIIDCKVYLKKTGHKLLSNWSKGDNIYCLLQKKGN